MSNIVHIKRQSTLKTVIKCTKKNGVEVEFSRYTGASESQSPEERKEFMSHEGFVLPNGQILYLDDIQLAFSKALDVVLESKSESKEKENLDFPVSFKSIRFMTD